MRFEIKSANVWLEHYDGDKIKMLNIALTIEDTRANIVYEGVMELTAKQLNRLRLINPNGSFPEC